MSQFDESKHNRATDGKFANKVHAEAEGISLEGEPGVGARDDSDRMDEMEGFVMDAVERISGDGDTHPETVNELLKAAYDMGRRHRNEETVADAGLGESDGVVYPTKPLNVRESLAAADEDGFLTAVVEVDQGAYENALAYGGLDEALDFVAEHATVIPAYDCSYDVIGGGEGTLQIKYTSDVREGAAAFEMDEDDDEDATYPYEDWQHEVSNGDTRRSYEDWVVAQREANQD